MNKAKLSVVCDMSQKTGKPYKALIADFGWTKKVLTFDTSVLLHFVTIQELSSLSVGEEFLLGEVDTHI